MVATDTGLSRPAQIEGANFLNLLIVDDDRAVREACREVAQTLGFTPQVAESARTTAIHTAQRFSDHAPLIIDYDWKL